MSALAHVHLPCGWCGTTNTDLHRTNCVNCGGPLPPPPTLTGDDPGAPPPPAPRQIPDSYRRQVMLWKNVLVILGAVFTVVFCWSIIFPIIGIPMWIVGHRRGKGQLEALERGRAARAELISVEKDHSVKINNRSPWRIEYTFELESGEIREGWVHTWQALHSRRQPGEKFWVVYLPEDPEQSTVWPPVK